MTGVKQPRFFYGYVIVGVAFLIMAMEWTIFSFGIFFQSFITDFGWSRAATSGALSLCLVLFGFFSVLTGRLNDRYGPRLLVTVCALFIGLGYYLLSTVTSLWQLYLYYGVILSLGLSSTTVPLASTVARWFVRRRGIMTGITFSGLGAGGLVLSPLINWLITIYGWRTTYLIMAVTITVAVMAVAQLLRRDPADMGLRPYGESVAVANGSNATGLSFREAARTRRFWLLAFALLCFTLSTGSIQAHIVLHAVGLGVSSTRAVMVLALVGGFNFAGRITFGGISDRIGTKMALFIAFLLQAMALFWLLLAMDLWMLYLFAVVFGLGYGGIAALMSPSVAEQFGLVSHGVILGVIMIGVQISEGIGPLLGGYIFDITGAYSLAFILYGVVSFMGMVLVSRLKGPVAEKEPVYETR
jgi:MFS family permease